MRRRCDAPHSTRLPTETRVLAFWPAGLCCVLLWSCSAPPETLHIATLNLAHGRGLAASQLGWPKETYEANLDAVAKVINREKPDVLAVQEADAPSAWSGSFDHVERLVAATHFPYVHHELHFDAGIGSLKATYGTALLSRRELGDRASHRLPAGTWHTKGLVLASVELDGRPLIVTSVHLDSESTGARRKQVDKLVSILREIDTPIVLMGDLNSQWQNENDAVRLLALQLDLHAYHPEDSTLRTFRADALRRRIDWILLSPELEFVDYSVWPDQVSDHLGVAAEIRWCK